MTKFAALVNRLIAFVAIACAGISAEAAPRCQALALQQLERFDPPGYSIYLQNKESFINEAWWTCDDYVSDLNTAVHETSHAISADKNAYNIIDGTLLARAPESRDFYPPSEMASQLDANMDLSFYIVDHHDPEEPSSVHQFNYVLDEFNAYTNGLDTTNRLIKFKTDDDDSRDGAVAFMFFVEAYAKRAQAVHPQTWSALNTNPMRNTIQKLWAQAQAVETEACRLNVPGIQDGWYLERLCAPSGHEAISTILGYQPTCLQLCLQQARKRATDDSGANDSQAASSDSSDDGSDN